MNFEHFVNNYQRWLKSPRTLSEATKDDMYCSAVEYQTKPDYSPYVAFVVTILMICLFCYGAWFGL